MGETTARPGHRDPHARVAEQPFSYPLTRPFVEPDWRRLPGFRDVTREEWESAQWQRAHTVKNLVEFKRVLGDLLTEAWLDKLIDMGVHYTWYHTYRPVGPKMNPALALRPDQLVRTRKFIVEMRSKVPIAMIDAYYDHQGQALCPMSTGISHHVGPSGGIDANKIG